MDNGLGDFDALTHSFGIAADLAIGCVGHSNHIDGIRNLRLEQTAGNSAHNRHHGYELSARQVIVTAFNLRDIAQTSKDPDIAEWLFTEDGDRSRGWAKLARN